MRAYVVRLVIDDSRQRGNDLALRLGVADGQHLEELLREGVWLHHVVEPPQLGEDAPHERLAASGLRASTR
jgi:hypothetical protein